MKLSETLIWQWTFFMSLIQFACALKKLRLNFRTVVADPASPQPDGDVTVDKDSTFANKYEVAIALLGNVTENGYTKIRNKIMTEFGITKHLLPSYYLFLWVDMNGRSLQRLKLIL